MQSIVNSFLLDYFGIFKSLTFFLSGLILADSHGSFYCDDYDPVFYHLYTNENPLAAQVINSQNLAVIENTNYKPQCSTKILIHGWRSGALEQCTQVIKNGYISSTEYDCLNIFITDWSRCASNIYYFGPALFVKNVGYRVGGLIEYLVNNLSTPITNIHVIGHSLGAHVAGFAGKYIQEKGMVLPWVTGLDPAAILFYPILPERRLSDTDGICVETLHTTEIPVGYPCQLGKVSYFINGGKSQPGCEQSANLIEAQKCSHSLACFYFAEAVRLNTKNKFYSEKCISRNCCNSKAELDQKPGTNSTCKTHGIYAFNTNPYGLDHQFEYGIGSGGAVPRNGKDCHGKCVTS